MNKQHIAIALAELARIDSDVARALESVGLPEPRIRPQGFETLLSTIVSQQISTQAAKAIMGRVRALLPQPSAAAILALEDKTLREAGLSFRKIEYAKGLAQAVQSGHLDIVGLAAASNEEAIETIMTLRGFGRWSAEIYLMFSLQREDIFPADDLALQVALGRLKNLDQKPTPKQASILIEHWSPWRSAGSLFLWHYYRGAPNA
ncbi:MAG: DNA-3-methyladenine glycosylase II [Cellvibrionaceae bacterium]